MLRGNAPAVLKIQAISAITAAAKNPLPQDSGSAPAVLSTQATSAATAAEKIRMLLGNAPAVLKTQATSAITAVQNAHKSFFAY